MARTLTIDVSKTLDGYKAEQRKAIDAADTLVAKVTSENRAFSKEENEQLAELQKTAEDYGTRFKNLEKQAKLSEEMDEQGESRTRKDHKPGDKREGDKDTRAKEEREVFQLWCRAGMAGLNAEQREIMAGRETALGDSPEARALTTSEGASGGFTVPEGFMAEIDKAMKSFSGVMQSRAREIPTSTGNDLPWPTVNDTESEGEQIEENQAVTEGQPSFAQLVMKAYEFSSKLVLVPNTLLQDSAIPIEPLLAELFAERLGRILNRRLTTGTGANQPQGIVTAASLGKTAAGSTAITYDELVDLQHSIDPAYRPQSEWEFNDTTLSVLRKLKDSDGRPIWMPAATGSMADGAPGTLLGNPYHINQAMASPASGAKSVIFGDHSKYRIRRVRAMTLVRLTERYAEKRQVGFFAFVRVDGRLSNAGTGPIKYLIHT